MGQAMSCRPSKEHELFTAVQFGDLDTVEVLLQRDPALLRRTTVYDRHSVLHVAAANGQIEVSSEPLLITCIRIGISAWNVHVEV